MSIVITIARQLGAGGGPLGQRLADRLGFVYLDDEILRLAAAEIGATAADLSHRDEHCAGFWERWVGQLVAGSPEGVFTPLPPGTAGDRQLFELQARAIRQIAERRDAVIIGRAAGWILREHPGVICVFLHAPPAARVPAVMEAFGLDEPAALRLIARTDPDRARFVREMTGGDVCDARQHDLCLDTSRIGLDLAERFVVQLVEARLEARRGRAAG